MNLAHQFSDLVSGTTPCSVAFLVQIVQDIQLLCELEKRTLCFKNLPQKPIATANTVYHTIEAEVARLVAHPRLFSSDSLRMTFLSQVNIRSKAGKEFAEGWDASRSLFAESSKQIRDCQATWLHKTQDPTRVSWHQFLHMNGPGSGMDISMLPKEGKVHILPHAGTELLFNWLEANEEVQKGIRQVK